MAELLPVSCTGARNEEFEKWRDFSSTFFAFLYFFIFLQFLDDHTPWHHHKEIAKIYKIKQENTFKYDNGGMRILRLFLKKNG